MCKAGGRRPPSLDHESLVLGGQPKAALVDADSCIFVSHPVASFDPFQLQLSAPSHHDIEQTSLLHQARRIAGDVRIRVIRNLATWDAKAHSLAEHQRIIKGSALPADAQNFKKIVFQGFKPNGLQI